MKQIMYEKLVSLIRKHRTWIDVCQLEQHQTFMTRVNDELTPISCRALVLFAKKRSGVYGKGHSWNIPELMLDRAVNALKQRDQRFKARWKAGNIQPEDAEFIINHATHGFVSLNLKANDEDEFDY